MAFTLMAEQAALMVGRLLDELEDDEDELLEDDELDVLEELDELEALDELTELDEPEDDPSSSSDPHAPSRPVMIAASSKVLPWRPFCSAM
ncbi:hypothetical protein ACDA63_14480 [Uliginosibacterium sp. sgz301328]|uniref:hypothetical protein n=1 Tax=Uliginosibacterium sp. sgz301328 TaxID=3243764 RepID=UPI00359CBDA4